jgi:hypothetical protein
MDSLGRLILRFLLVPLGYLVAVVAGTLVILLGAWKLGQVAPHDEAEVMLGFMLAGPLLLVSLLCVMWLPSAVGILISEAFAVRSWVFHAANGAASAWIGWSLLVDFDDSRVPMNQPSAVIAAGLAGGLAYWAVAGSSAGFWKPVFRGRAPSSSPARVR